MIGQERGMGEFNSGLYFVNKGFNICGFSIKDSGLAKTHD